MAAPQDRFSLHHLIHGIGINHAISKIHTISVKGSTFDCRKMCRALEVLTYAESSQNRQFKIKLGDIDLSVEGLLLLNAMKVQVKKLSLVALEADIKNNGEPDKKYEELSWRFFKARVLKERQIKHGQN